MRRETSDASDRQRIGHMLRAARDAIVIAAGRTREDLDNDIMLQHALVHCIQLIGEAAARITDASRNRAPQLPWPRMAGMRNILVHAYFKIDYDTVWRVIAEDLPILITQLESALANWPG